MIRFSKLFFGFTVFVLLLWLLPWTYNFAFYKPCLLYTSDAADE